ncbi:NUDIX hydrolase [Amycolatopsis sp. NPDC051903]|uniref:NUDIX hydrolase n=1 Tax=Amycolatopsis sp. NPDC051903 TaxID=3363936 RepID=UPI00378F3A48
MSAEQGPGLQGPGSPWQVGRVRPVLDSPWLRVGLADVTKPSGQFEEHYMVWLPPAAVVVVLDEPGEHVLLGWRHRFVPDVWGYEIPGGLIEDGEAPAATARRELLEETGFRARGLRHLVTFEPAVGIARNPHHVFLARGAEQVDEPTECDEGVFGWVPMAQVPALIAAGKITNSGTLVGLLYVLADRAADA